jgi:4-carboxymuconolactone decarboxylase
MPRPPSLDPARLTARQREVHDRIASGPRGSVEGPLRVWLHSPELADRAQALGAFCRYGTSLPPRLSELAILVTGAAWRAGFEWHVHAPIGLAAGLDPAVVEAIRVGAPPHLKHADEAAVYAVAREVVYERQVSDASYARAETVLGLSGLIELVVILGYYGLISMTINVFKVPVPDGAPEPFRAEPT